MPIGRRKILRLYWLAHCPDEKGKSMSFTDVIRRCEFFCKYSERRVQRQSGKTKFSHLWHCRAASCINKNTAKGECSGKVGKQSFHIFGTAEPHPVLIKYNERRAQRQSGKTTFSHLWHCRAASCINKIQRKASAAAKLENNVFTSLALPSRIMY